MRNERGKHPSNQVFAHQSIQINLWRNKMKRTIVFIAMLVFIGGLILSCQKAEGPREKAGQTRKVQTKQEAEGEEAKEGQKQSTNTTLQTEQKSEIQKERKAEGVQGEKAGVERNTKEDATEGTTKEGAVKAEMGEKAGDVGVEFKEPVLLWEREFSPPLIDISEQNSRGEYIAVQGGSKYLRPTKVLFLDGRGRTLREVDLRGIQKRRIPAEEVWLTYYGEQYRAEDFRRRFKEGKEIEVKAWRAYVSGNGERYAVVWVDRAGLCEEQEGCPSAWYEFRYYDSRGRLLWRHVPDVNYGFSRAYVSYDGSRVVIVDEAELDYFGQKWYLYDGEGRLLRSEDHWLRMDGTQEEREEEEDQWIREIKISTDTKYVCLVNENRSFIKIINREGKVEWIKSFHKEIVYSVEITDKGSISVRSSKYYYLINKRGKTLWKVPFTSQRIRISKKEDLFLTEDSYSFSLFNSEGKFLYRESIKDIFGNSNIKWIIDIHVEDPFLFISFSYSDRRRSSFGIFDIVNRRKIWRSNKVWESTNYPNLLYIKFFKDSKNFMLIFPEYARITIVSVYQYTGGKR